MSIQIPAEYRDQFEPYESQEKRTDEEILRTFYEFQPVTSEKNIWTFWDSGVKGMPAWCRRNVISWARICGPEWTVRVLDSDKESPNYAGKYIPTGLPEAFYKQTMNGSHAGPHSADFLRGACLYDYGGAWVDSSTFFMRSMDDICWDKLEDPASPLRVAVPVIAGNLLNCFLAARKHDPFIKRWHDIFMHVWEGRTNPDGLANHPILAPIVPHFLESMLAEMGEGFGLKAPPEKVAEYGLQMVCWRRVCMLEDDGEGFSGADYWVNNVMWLDCPKELMGPFYDFELKAPIFTRGPKLFDLFAMKRDGPKDSPEYREAEQTVWNQLTESSMMKIGTIKGMVDWVSLGTLWNRPENLGKDDEPGTFGELLRYIPTHFKQIKKEMFILESERPAVTFRKGVLEP